MTPKDRLSVPDAAMVEGLIRALAPFYALNRRLPIRCVQAFLAVAFEEGRSVTYYAKRLGMQLPTMSRNLLDIGPRNRFMTAGYGLVTHRRNPNNMSELQYFLSNKGRAVLNNMLDQVRPAA